MLIVKKMPILQGFPDFETVKNLSGNATENVNFSPLFYDIETTGLGRTSSFLYLIGAVCYESSCQILLRGFLLLTCIKCFAL